MAAGCFMYINWVSVCLPVCLPVCPSVCLYVLRLPSRVAHGTYAYVLSLYSTCFLVVLGSQVHSLLLFSPFVFSSSLQPFPLPTVLLFLATTVLIYLAPNSPCKPERKQERTCIITWCSIFLPHPSFIHISIFFY